MGKLHFYISNCVVHSLNDARLPADSIQACSGMKRFKLMPKTTDEPPPKPDELNIRVLHEKHYTLASLCASWEPMEFDLPDVDACTLPQDDINL